MTNNTKFTPGEWTICRSIFNGAETGYHIAGPVHGSVFPICRKEYETGEDNATAQANAALIATSPELYAELERCHAIP